MALLSYCLSTTGNNISSTIHNTQAVVSDFGTKGLRNNNTTQLHKLQVVLYISAKTVWILTDEQTEIAKTSFGKNKQGMEVISYFSMSKYFCIEESSPCQKVSCNLGAQ